MNAAENPVCPALEVNGICRNFGGVVALRDVSFAVSAGEVVGLIGPNGAGKSTLFEIVSGNLPPSAGRISYFGTDFTAMPTHLRRREGMCRTFQKVRLFESMSVADNIRVAASQCVPEGRDVREEVAAILAQLRLEAQAQRRPAELTLADRKRVEIGRAIAGNCRLLMLDESLSGLTHEEAEHLISEILVLNRVRGITEQCDQAAAPGRKMGLIDHRVPENGFGSADEVGDIEPTQTPIINASHRF